MIVTPCSVSDFVISIAKDTSIKTDPWRQSWKNKVDQFDKEMCFAAMISLLPKDEELMDQKKYIVLF